MVLKLMTQLSRVKIGMMGPLLVLVTQSSGLQFVPILGALGASLAAWQVTLLVHFYSSLDGDIIRMAFLWYTQELGYKAGSEITKDLSGGIIQKITKGASILGMFILAVLVERWVSITFTVNLPATQLSEGAYIEFPKGTCRC